MFITVQVRSVYGKDLVYPVDDKARVFTCLTGKQTFTSNDLRVIKSLGYEVRVAAGTLPFAL